MAETSDCTKGVGATRNNCFGIKRNGQFVTYTSKEESYKDFKETWSKYYGGYPTLEQAKRWTGNDKPSTWLWIVAQYY